MPNLVRGDASSAKGGELTSGTQTISGDKTFSGILTPTTMGGQLKFSQQTHTTTTTETALSVASTQWRFDGGAALTIQGIAGGAEGRMLYLSNNSGFNVTLTYNSGSAPAANRINLQGNQDKVILPNCSVALIYQGSRWNTVGAIDTTVSGRYTPTVTSGTNCATTTAQACMYTRVGNIVTVSGRVDVSTTAGTSTATDLTMTLPIASNLVSSMDLQGSGTRECSAGTPYMAAVVVADTVNDKAQFFFNSTVNANNALRFTFQYEII